MKRWVIFSGLLILSGVLTASSAAENASGEARNRPIGQVIAIQGQAIALDSSDPKDPSEKPRNLELKSPIFLNDKIITKEKSKIQIMLDDDTVISQGEKSQIVIDKYVYDPENKEKSNSSMKIAKGLFRVITGKISHLNPERFKVHTKMATIGIRGCELGFIVAEDTEDVFVLQLPEGKSILIQKFRMIDHELREMLPSYIQSLNVTRAGVGVLIQAGLDLKERLITEQEMKQFLQGATLTSTSKDNDKSLDSKGAVGSKLQKIKETVSDVSANKSQSDRSKTAEEKLEEEEEKLSIFARPSDEDIGELPPLPAPPTEAPSQPSWPYGDPPKPGMGIDWYWGFWSDGSSYYSGNYLSAANYQAIVDGSHIYTLSGSGVAGAAIDHNGIIKFVDGSCSLNVEVGSSSSYTWDGMFNMFNCDEDSLNFGAAGNVLAGGLLSGSLTSYSMQVSGNSFSDVTSQSIDGKLVGPGTGSTPITGAVGNYNFGHGGQATVQGVFGADLSEAH